MDAPSLFDLFSANVSRDVADATLARFAMWYKSYRAKNCMITAKIYFVAFWKLAHILSNGQRPNPSRELDRRRAQQADLTPTHPATLCAVGVFIFQKKYKKEPPTQVRGFGNWFFECVYSATSVLQDKRLVICDRDDVGFTLVAKSCTFRATRDRPHKRGLGFLHDNIDIVIGGGRIVVNKP